MLKKYFNYIKAQGLKEYTPSYNKSTCFDYQSRVERLAKEEHISINQLALDIDYYVNLYGKGGLKEQRGSQSNHAYIRSLIYFQKFVKEEKPVEYLTIKRYNWYFEGNKQVDEVEELIVKPEYVKSFLLGPGGIRYKKYNTMPYTKWVRLLEKDKNFADDIKDYIMQDKFN